MSRPTYVIVGASLAGGRAAETLRSGGFEGRVVLVGDEPARPYERPPLSKEVLRGEKPPDVAFLRPEEWYAENDVELLLGRRASSVDRRARTVSLDGGETLAWDALLLATGGRPRPLRVPGGDLEGVHTLRTMADSEALRARLAPGVPLVVVGAGFIGAEVASSAVALGCAVTVLEMLAVPMERALGGEVGSIWAGVLRDGGADLRPSTGVERIERSGEALRVVTTAGDAIEAAAVVAGVGIDPNDELARAEGLACENGVLVNERCETSAPGVYAAGDVARHPNPILGETIRVEHWQNAQNQGVAAARSMLGGSEPFAEVPWFWSDQFGLNLQMAGHPTAWDEIVFRGDVEARSFLAFYLRDARLVAALGVGRGKEVRAARTLVASRARLDPRALADDSTDLKSLAV